MALLAGGVTIAHAKRLQPESAYQSYFAEKVGGEVEVVCGDGTRCDIVTDSHSIEVDFANMWGEAKGKSLNCAFQLNNKAGMLSILESENDYRHFVETNPIFPYLRLKIDIRTVDTCRGEGVVADSLMHNKTETAAAYCIFLNGKTHNLSCRCFTNSKSIFQNDFQLAVEKYG